MNFKKKAIILSSAIGFLFFIYVCSFIFTQSEVTQIYQKIRIASPVTVTKATRIEIISSLEIPLFIVKKDANWILHSTDGIWPINQDRVLNLLNEITKIDQGEIVSKSKESFASFSLLEEQAVHVKVFGESNNILSDFYMGKLDARGSGIYVRQESSQSVFIVSSKFSDFVDSNRKPWLLLNVVKKAPQELVKITCKADFTIASSNRKKILGDYSIVRTTDTIFNFEANKSTALNTQAVSAVFSLMTYIQAEDFSSEPYDKAITSKPNAVITLHYIDDTIQTLQVGQDTGNGTYFMHDSNTGKIFIMSAYTLDNIIKNADDLMEIK